MSEDPQIAFITITMKENSVPFQRIALKRIPLYQCTFLQFYYFLFFCSPAFVVSFLCDLFIPNVHLPGFSADCNMMPMDFSGELPEGSFLSCYLGIRIIWKKRKLISTQRITIWIIILKGVELGFCFQMEAFCLTDFEFFQIWHVRDES